MADYTPVIVPGATFTSTASAAVTGGDVVEVSGDDTVRRATGVSSKVIGVAGHDAASGQRVTIFACVVIHKGVADGVITAGDQLSSTGTANRSVKTVAPAAVAAPADFAATATSINTTAAATRSIIGVALNGGADGATVRWAAT